MTPDDQYLIMATDGVWEFLDSEDVVDVVDKHFKSGKPANDACKFIIAKAARQWMEHEGDYRDDITVIVVYLRPLVEMLREANGGSVHGSPNRMSTLAESFSRNHESITE